MTVYRAFSEKTVEVLRGGGVAVVPTDTIYGIVAGAFNKEAVERVYTLKKRDRSKPCINLVANIESIAQYFNINPEKEAEELLAQPKTTVIFPAPNSQLDHLHRGTYEHSFRIPHHKELRTFLESVGPIIAPSANLEGKPPAHTVEQAQMYFGDRVDCYVDGGTLHSQPSLIFLIKENGDVVSVR